MTRCSHAVSTALVLLAVLAPGRTARAQPKPSAPVPAQIDRNGTLILVRSVLLALHQANETGNYTVLRDLAAPGFREANTAAQLSEIFTSQRAQRLDLSGVAAFEPQFVLAPQIEANGMLRMAGFFPSIPTQINFELLFAPVEGRWRPYGVSVAVGPAGPAPPQPVARPEPRSFDAKAGDAKAGDAKAGDAKPSGKLSAQSVPPVRAPAQPKVPAGPRPGASGEAATASEPSAP